MGKQTKLKKILEDLVNTKEGVKSNPAAFQEIQTARFKKRHIEQEETETPMEQNQTSSLKLKALIKNKKTPASKEKADTESKNPQTKSKNNITSIKKILHKETQPQAKGKPVKPDNQGMDFLKAVEARKIQMMTKSGMDPGSSSPLQMHLVHSESLRIAQDKIIDLEEELHELRQKNKSLVSASEVLKEKNDRIISQLEDLKYSLKEEKNNFKDEKEVLLSALEEAKTQIDQLKGKKQELERQLSSDLYGIRNRENSLESRIEILKMENSVLQREKDKKIIELKRQIQKIKSNLDGAHKKIQDLQVLNNKLQESSRRTVSALRATIYNLEGVSAKEETFATEVSKKDNF